jgi:hypothetical protein
LAKAAGIGNPTREQLARQDRKRKKKGSNGELCFGAVAFSRRADLFQAWVTRSPIFAPKMRSE